MVDLPVFDRHIGRRQIARGENLAIHLSADRRRQIAQVERASGAHRRQHGFELDIEHGHCCPVKT
jgi:hypothetical protein